MPGNLSYAPHILHIQHIFSYILLYKKNHFPAKMSKASRMHFFTEKDKKLPEGNGRNII